MISLSLLAALSAAVSAAPQYGGYTVDNTQPAGTNPIQVSNTQLLGPLIANNSCSVRDLGFTGKLGNEWYAMYGDTLWCEEGETDPTLHREDNFQGMVRNAVSRMTDDPLIVEDLHLNEKSRQQQFIPFREDWGETSQTAFWPSSLCETNGVTGEGIVYYITAETTTTTADCSGVGAARVALVDGVPTVTERIGNNGVMWDSQTTARYGDIAAYRDERSDWIYLYGWAPESITDTIQKQYIYVARVRSSDAFDVSKYEYYWGRQVGWKTDVLNQWTSETAVLFGTGQGQIVWNEYYQTYIFVGMCGTDVALQTAPSPEGPWTAAIDAYAVTDVADDKYPPYAGVAHPWLDTSGKSLTVSFTNAPNRIEVVKIDFA